MRIYTNNNKLKMKTILLIVTLTVVGMLSCHSNTTVTTNAATLDKNKEVKPPTSAVQNNNIY